MRCPTAFSIREAPLRVAAKAGRRTPRRMAAPARDDRSPMRIAIDGRPLRHPHTGIGVYVRELMARIAERCELFVYLDRAMPVTFGAAATFRMPAWPGPGSPAAPLAGFLAANVLFAQWARRDRVHAFWSPRHHLPLALGDVPAVVTVHDMVWRTAPSTMRPLNRLLDAALLPLALGRAKRVIAVSEYTRSQILRWRRRPGVCVTPLAPVAPAHVRPFHHPRPYFLFVGTKEPRKNIPGLIEGFGLAVAGGLPPCDLLLVGGEGWKQGTLARLIEASGAAHRIRDLGALSDERLAGVYAGSTAVVLPSFDEGFGIPLVEGMHYGKPAIAAHAGALPEVAGDAALLIDPTQPRDIAGAITRLATDAALRQRLAANARRRAKRYSWERTAARTLEILEAAAR